jgi:hypothetical protein
MTRPKMKKKLRKLKLPEKNSNNQSGFLIKTAESCTKP